jgi:hypothetical protein
MAAAAARAGRALALSALLMAAAAGDVNARREVEPPLAHGRVPESVYTLRRPHLFTHNVGSLTLQVTNLGVMGNPFLEEFSAGWRGAEYLNMAGLWIAAIGGDSDPHVSTATTFEFRPDLSPVATIYESSEGIAGGFRLGPINPAAADDDEDGLYDEDFHNGLDDDGDGLVDEDYSAIGQQMFSAVYRDDAVEAVQQYADHVPLGLKVYQRTFQWAATGINEMVGMDFLIVNDGDQELEEIYLGFMTDADVGPRSIERYWTDDLGARSFVGATVDVPGEIQECDTKRVSGSVVFMYDGAPNTMASEPVPGVFGNVLLGYTTDYFGIKAPSGVGLNSVNWFSTTGASRELQTDEERYAAMTGSGSSDRIVDVPRDYSYLMSSGPFPRLRPGESLVYQTAFVVGNGFGGFFQNAVSALQVFDGRYIDADQDPATGEGGRELCLQVLEPGEVIVWDDPCDSLEIPDPPHKSSECKWVDSDCSLCTGKDGEEHLIRWVGTTLAPSPNVNTDLDLDPRAPGFDVYVPPAGDRRVVLQWDNSSELRVDPITGESHFEGYRIWRVDNWQRPLGEIGPGADEWFLVAEFRLHPADSLRLGSPHHLRRVTDLTVPPVGSTKNEERIFPIGRYTYADTSGLLNGKAYYYSVTAFDVIDFPDPITGELVPTEIGGQPAAFHEEAVIPRWGRQKGGMDCDRILVVPNPYRGSADWDLIPNDLDPTGTKIALRNLPEGTSTIRIFTVSGDLIETVEHDSRVSGGTYFWNLLSRNGQPVVSGIYLYAVVHGGTTCRGRFVIMR